MPQGLKYMGQLRKQKGAISQAISNAKNLEQEFAMLEAQFLQVQVDTDPEGTNGDKNSYLSTPPCGLLKRMLKQQSSESPGYV
jgi:hypothetical protein